MGSNLLLNWQTNQHKLTMERGPDVRSSKLGFYKIRFGLNKKINYLFFYEYRFQLPLFFYSSPQYFFGYTKLCRFFDAAFIAGNERLVETLKHRQLRNQFDDAEEQRVRVTFEKDFYLAYILRNSLVVYNSLEIKDWVFPFYNYEFIYDFRFLTTDFYPFYHSSNYCYPHSNYHNFLIFKDLYFYVFLGFTRFGNVLNFTPEGVKDFFRNLTDLKSYNYRYNYIYTKLVD